MLISKKYLVFLIVVAVFLFLSGCADKQVQSPDLEKEYLKDLTEQNSKQPGAGMMIEPE